MLSVQDVQSRYRHLRGSDGPRLPTRKDGRPPGIPAQQVKTLISWLLDTDKLIDGHKISWPKNTDQLIVEHWPADSRTLICWLKNNDQISWLYDTDQLVVASTHDKGENWVLRGLRSSSFWLPRNLSNPMDRQACTEVTVLVKNRENRIEG
jgi:hypothetical protein